MGGREEVGEVSRTRGEWLSLQKVLDFEANQLLGGPSLHSWGLLEVACAQECLPCEFSAGELALVLLRSYTFERLSPASQGKPCSVAVLTLVSLENQLLSDTPCPRESRA